MDGNRRKSYKASHVNLNEEAVMSVKKIPEGYTTITPSLTIDGAAKAIELYTKAFGAKEAYRMETPGTKKIMHACLEIGSSKIFLSDVHPEMCPTPSASAFYLYMDDVDASFKKATQAGMKETSAPQDMFWGDRVGNVKDAFGISWTIATHVRDVSPQEMAEGQKKFASKAA
jgi:PhnB protein